MRSMNWHTRRTPVLRTLLVAVTTLLATMAGPFALHTPVAEAAGVQLYAGDIQYSGVISCASIALGSPLYEAGLGTYIGFYADPDNGLPGLNQTFYVEVHLAGLGYPCGGQHASVELVLPAGVTLNVAPSSPIQCFAGNQAQPANVCAQSMQPSPYHPGALWYPSPDNGAANTWPLAQGSTWTFKFPVRSSVLQSNALLKAFVHVVDGWDNPTLQPQMGLFVFNGSTPTVLYATPSTVFTPVPNSINFNTISTVTVYKPSAQTGTILFDIATNSSFTPTLFTDSGPVPGGYAAPEMYTNWVPASGPFAIQPNTTYYWRARYQPSGGGQVVGATQRFTTPNAGNKTIGDGTAASCTLAALKASFTDYTQRVDFNCGPLPVSIQLDSGYTTDGPLTIDGKGKVTLIAAPNTRIFQNNSGELTLKGLTLQGGNSNGCGGAVQIFDGSATLDHVRLLNNHAAAGGGLCVMSGTSVTMYDSVVSGNTANENGGGIYAGGTMGLYRSEVSNNTANSTGGGGVYSDGPYFDGFFSLFSGNTANGATYGRGGGLLFESGTGGNIVGSTVSGNKAVKGGGVHNEGDTYLSSVTVANNTSTGSTRGGGIESETTGFAANLHLRNTIVANNVNTNTGVPVNSNCSTVSAFRQNTSLGHNLISDFSCSVNEFGDMQNTDPKLRPLSMNGGTTRTHALPVTSPAVDTGDSTYCAQFDQRGVTDPVDEVPFRILDGDSNGSKVCDIGAFELQPSPVYQPITPARLMDTRPANGTTDPTTGLSSNSVVTVDGDAQNLGARAAGSTYELRVAGRTGIPMDALAVSVNVTSNGSAANGWVTLFPCGSPVPSTSTLNYAANTTVANAATVPLGTDGKLCVFTSAASNVIVDVNGYMPAASRYQALPPKRLVDTRPNGDTDDGLARRTGVIAAGTSQTFQITGRGGVANGTTAVMLNVTVPGAGADGYVTVYPCGTVPTTSSLNVKAGTTVANAVFTGLSNSGTICVYASAALNVIADISGAVPTGTTMVPLPPARLLDSRPTAATPADDGVNTVRPAGSVTKVQVTGRGGVSAAAQAVVLNITAVAPAANGYLTVFPCDAAQPNTSSLNYAATITRANQVIVKVPTTGVDAGKVCILTSQQTNLLTDVMGQVT